MIEETKEELANWYSPRGNLNGRERTNAVWSVEGTRAWGELFVPDTPDEQIQFGRNNQVLEEAFMPLENVGVQGSTGVQNNASVQSDTEVQNNAGVLSGTRVQNMGTNNSTQQKKGRVPMVSPKEKLPEFNGDGTTDLIRHCEKCETVWIANGVMDEDNWVR